MSDKNLKTYSSFADINEVCETFDYMYEYDTFIQEKEYKMAEVTEANIRYDFANLKNFVNEFVICESILRPILSDVARTNDLPLFSHIKLEYDKDLGLSGEPNYFLAPLTSKGASSFTTPVVCLVESRNNVDIKKK